MSDNSKISWTDASWNAVTGCTEVSPGCAHCYAKVFAERWRGVKGNYYENGFDVTLRLNMLERPLSWKKPRRIFVNSMSDLFHEDVEDGYIDNCFAIMALCPQHTFQILTKRIERASAYVEEVKADANAERVHQLAWERRPAYDGYDSRLWPLPNVLIGPTIENQAMMNKRGPYTSRLHSLGWRTMVSYEPALTPVNFLPLGADRNFIDWLICGGESGPDRRPFNHEWARSALAQARDAGIPFFMKQDGALRSEVYDTLPDDLKVREFPA